MKIVSKSSMMDEKILEAFLAPGRGSSRSMEYQQGWREALRRRVTGSRVVCPWPPGSTKADAFFSGVDHCYEYCNREGIERSPLVPQDDADDLRNDARGIEEYIELSDGGGE